MAELIIGSDSYHDHTETSEQGKAFVVLGRQLPAGRSARRSARVRRRNRIHRRTRAPADEVWGTLGLDGAGSLTWSGRLRYSAEGNARSLPQQSMPVTCREIELLRQTVPEAAAGGGRVLERYISLEDVRFEDLPEDTPVDDLPRLRLTLMLGPDEGALVYYQLYPTGTAPDASAQDEVDLEYVQPKPTPGHRCDERDRLDYSIPLLPARRIREHADGSVRASGRALQERFVIKVLTFRRDNAESESVLRRLHHHVWGRTHALLGWQPASGRFSGIDGSALKPDTPTLLLIHGTASSTEIAFSGLLEGDSRSWLARLHAANGGPYGQIVGFDHPTFSENAAMNAAALLDRLPRGFEFSGGTDLITHSRGGLLGKHLVLNASALHVRRGALAACANGVGYFTAGRRVARLLSVLRATAGAAPMLKGLMALAQHSGEYLMNRPGARLMTPGSDSLAEVLRDPRGPQPPCLLPVVGNFERRLVAHHPFYRRWAERGLDLLLKPILGAQHDWVVGTREQYIMPGTCYPAGWDGDGPKPARIHAARHSGYFVMKNGRVKNPAPERIEHFLRTGRGW